MVHIRFKKVLIILTSIQTIDGNDTFLSLARVCFQQTVDGVYASEDPSIPKRKEYAL